jgi:hypothetical protein
MAPLFDAARNAAAEGAQRLEEFEPDPDGNGSVDCPLDASGSDDDPQWVVWEHPEEESDWAANELSQLAAAPRKR